MEKWKSLLHRQDLSEEEIKRIPASSCENHINVLNYFVQHKGLSEEELLQGIECSPEMFKDPNNWLNPLDEKNFHLNIFRNSKELLTHYDLYEAGVNFRFSQNTLFQMIFKLLSAGQIFKEASKHVRKFNNEYDMKPVTFKPGKCLFKIVEYPFYRTVSVGHECRYIEGVYAANLEIHNIGNYSIRHIICGKTIAGIIRNVYGHLNWSYKDDGEYIYINHQKVAKHVRLKQERTGTDVIFIKEIDTGAVVHNAVQIINDFTFGNRVIFYRGEIYNAPYCLIDVEWKEPIFLKRLFNSLVRKWSLEPHYAHEMENEIEFANEKLFEAQEALRESERKSKIFQVYTKASLVSKVDRGEDPTEYLPEKKDMAVLFSDIRHFTSISESMDAIEMVKFLNAYFNRMNRPIIENNGEIDKLMGDCIMAGFYDEENPEAGVENAVRAAVEMRKRLQQYNKQRREYFEKHILPIKPHADFIRIENGVGITFGSVVTGNIGSSKKLDYTLIGDVVNASSRLESLTKYYGVGILVSEDVKELLPGSFDIRFVDVVLVKGKSKPLMIYEVFDHEPDFIKETKFSIQDALDKALELYLDGYFNDAKQVYSELSEKVGQHSYVADKCADPLLDFYISRCDEMDMQIKTGIIDRETWKGVYVFKDK